MSQVTVLPRPEGRLCLCDEERQQIQADAFAPGARVADACRTRDVLTGLVYTWRRKLLGAGKRAPRVL
jgi:transposase